MAGFLEELKRRNVIRVAILYVVTAWLMLQAADVGMSALGLPDWTGKLVMFLLALGFPIALTFSWIYELTPEGIKRDSEVDRSESITTQTGHRINITIGVLLVVTLVVVMVDRFVLQPPVADTPATAAVPSGSAADAVEDKSIAVLPFANLSGNPDEDYFSDGMTEELLNVLAKNTALKVAARTSVFRYKGEGGDIREIGAELGVAHVIEGSIRRDGERIRVTAQLIRVDDGFHVWSETYDRELKSVFAIQDDIAQRIARELEATLGADALVPEPRADVNPAAYEDYLKGRALYRARSDLPRAVAHFERTVELAPDMAAAWSSLCLSLEVAHWFASSLEHAALGDVLGRMRVAAGQAARLEPRSAMTLHALANVARSDLRFAEAERLYLQSIAADPTYPDVREDYSEFLYHMGFPGESLAASRDLVALEPLVWVFWARIGDVGMLLDRDDLIEEFYERVNELAPTEVTGLLGRYGQALANGRYEDARDLMEDAYRRDPASVAPDRAMFLWSMGGPGIDDETARFVIRRKSVFVQYAIPKGNLDLFFESARLSHVPEARYTLFYSLGLPIAAPLLSDPRAKALIRDLGFEAYWRQRGWPALCRPLGDDDFECGPAAGGET